MMLAVRLRQQFSFMFVAWPIFTIMPFLAGIIITSALVAASFL